MTTLGATIFLIVTFPLLFWCAWTDLKSMRIPNNTNIMIFGVFLVLGAFFMPLPEFGLRLVQAFVVLTIFFFLNSAGLIGGGDAKLFAAIAPYVALPDLTGYLVLLSLLTLAAVAGHRVAPLIPVLKDNIAGWESWNGRKKFPFGLPLAMSLSAYLIMIIQQG